MITRDQLEKEHIQQAIYKFALDVTKKDQSEFTKGQFVLNKTNSKYTEFELKSKDLSKWGQGNVIVQVNHKTENVEVFEQEIDKNNLYKKDKTFVWEEKLSEILKEYGLSKEDYKETFKKEALDEMNEGIEQDQYKEFFKGQVLSNIEEKETAKEKWQYKERFKNGILKLLNAEPKQPMKHVEKEDVKANHDKNVKIMKEFEKSHSFDTIYQLRKEAFNELKEMDLTEPQKEKLLKLEENLDKQKQEYDKNVNKTNSSKENNEKKNEKQKKKSLEMER
ncbi:hypothetical protein [Bacillus cereus]|uniref:hypothetical protein n=1 Tax=Bacillus cereus TaxID=1396 RepID=UPI00123BD2CD|nr:hypothetical protein [Bacillus cereus]KAA6457693.1 hypothetical protein DX930_29610 [Bacillus cereus]KAB2414470.1 hypothetical protein F8169_21155 [Bacillus cereus]KAB2435489.1 hypothetical protein F8166_16710 [Bacillus cereus]KAB2461647.1 hypothetical protein F8164_30435 [Bacillus cereus]